MGPPEARAWRRGARARVCTLEVLLDWLRSLHPTLLSEEKDGALQAHEGQAEAALLGLSKGRREPQAPGLQASRPPTVLSATGVCPPLAFCLKRPADLGCGEPLLVQGGAFPREFRSSKPCQAFGLISSPGCLFTGLHGTGIQTHGGQISVSFPHSSFRVPRTLPGIQTFTSNIGKRVSVKK